MTVQGQGSFTRAAATLGITQAAVSQQIASLESELRVVLFDRRGRRVVLTPSAVRFQAYAEKILRLVDEAHACVQGEAVPVSGTLRIAASTVPAESLLPNLLAAFRDKFTCVRQQLDISDSRSAATAVAQGDAEVAFLGVQPSQKKLVHRALADDELVLVVHSESRLASRKSVSLKQLTTLPLIVREAKSGSRLCLEQALAERELSLEDMQIAMEANSNEAIRTAVAQGSGVAFLSAKTVEKDLQTGRLATIKVRRLRPRRQLFIAYVRGSENREPLRSFLRFMDNGR